MFRTKLFCGAQIIVLTLLLAGCEKKASDEIDFGAINNSIYKNNYFGMTVTLPPDWSIQSQEAQKRNLNTGERILAGDDKNLNAVMKASELRVVNLFAASKYPKGSPVSYNPSILALAEDVRDFPGIKRGSDYHFHAKQLMQSGSLDVSFPKDIYTQSLGGIDFDIMEVEIHVRGIVVRQKYYATIMKGYAVNIIISFTTDEDEASLQKIIDTLKFN
jgi:hypothetical protein